MCRCFWLNLKWLSLDEISIDEYNKLVISGKFEELSVNVFRDQRIVVSQNIMTNFCLEIATGIAFECE